MAVFMDIKGTSQQTFQIQKGGARIKNASGVIQIRNAADGAYADLVAQILKAAGNSLELNTAAAGAGADWKMTIARPASGMTAAVTYTLPAAPVNGYVLATDASGNLSWVSPGSTAGKADLNRATQGFADTSKTIVAGVSGQQIFLHTLVGRITAAFDIDPLLTVGDTTNPSSVIAATQYDLSEMSVGDVISVPFGGSLTVAEALTAAFGAAPTTGSIQWSLTSVYV
jgi:hypothetical protein